MIQIAKTLHTSLPWMELCVALTAFALLTR